MDALRTFLDQAFSMPTTVWSVLLILVAAYWLLSLLSGMDIEALDHLDAVDHLDALDHLDAVDAIDAMEALDGVDHALDGFDGSLDHAIDGALDGGIDHALDSLDGHEDAIGGAGAHRTGLFRWLGFSDVPKTFSLSLVVVFGWLVSYFGTGWLTSAGKWAAAGLGAVILLGLVSLTLAVGMTAVALVPMRKMLILRVGPESFDLLGERCVVKTGRVDQRFGQAETSNGHLVQVRALDGRQYTYGESALIFDYDPDDEVFYIAPLDADLGIPARSTE